MVKELLIRGLDMPRREKYESERQYSERLATWSEKNPKSDLENYIDKQKFAMGVIDNDDGSVNISVSEGNLHWEYHYRGPRGLLGARLSEKLKESFGKNVTKYIPIHKRAVMHDDIMKQMMVAAEDLLSRTMKANGYTLGSGAAGGVGKAVLRIMKESFRYPEWNTEKERRLKIVKEMKVWYKDAVTEFQDLCDNCRIGLVDNPIEAFKNFKEKHGIK